MKDQVFMSPHNGQLVLGMPLFRIAHDGAHFMEDQAKCSIQMFINKPLAYIVHADKLMKPQVWAADWVEKQFINLGDI